MGRIHTAFGASIRAALLGCERGDVRGAITHASETANTDITRHEVRIHPQVRGVAEVRRVIADLVIGTRSRFLPNARRAATGLEVKGNISRGYRHLVLH